MKKDEYAVEFPERKKKPYEMFFDLLFEGEKLDAVDGITDEEDGMRSEGEFQTTMEEHIEKLLEAKMDKLQSTLQLELQEMFVKMNDKLKEDFEKKKQI